MSSVTFSRSLLDALGIKAGDHFTFEVFVRLVRAIEARLKPLEDQSGSLDAAIEAVRKVGLDRINEVLVPAIELVFEIQSKGFLVARSSTPATLHVGDVLTLVVGDDQGRALFTPGPFVALTREANADDYAICRTVDYNQASGVLLCQVQAFSGDPGPHSDWVIGALAASTIAGQTILEQTQEEGEAFITAAQLLLVATQAARDVAAGHVAAAAAHVVSAAGQKDLAVAARNLAEGYATAASGARDTALAHRDAASGFKDAAQAAAELAQSFVPANFYNKAEIDGAFDALETATTAAFATRDSAITDVANAAATIRADAATAITANRTAVAGEKLLANSAGGAIIVTLPATPANGVPVRVFRDGANNVTIARNGSTIEGVAEDLVLDEDKRGVRMTYLFGTWKAFPEVLA